MDTIDQISEWLSQGTGDRTTSLSHAGGRYVARLKEYRPETGLTLTVSRGEGFTVNDAFGNALAGLTDWCD